MSFLTVIVGAGLQGRETAEKFVRDSDILAILYIKQSGLPCSTQKKQSFYCVLQGVVWFQRSGLIGFQRFGIPVGGPISTNFHRNV